MEKEQIIKALEQEIRLAEYVDSSYCDGVEIDLIKNAIALINELTEENERLREKADRNLDNLKAVLEERNENTLVADTVREFAERVKAFFKNYKDMIPSASVHYYIAEIEREFLEGKK